LFGFGSLAVVRWSVTWQTGPVLWVVSERGGKGGQPLLTGLCDERARHRRRRHRRWRRQAFDWAAGGDGERSSTMAVVAWILRAGGVGRGGVGGLSSAAAGIDDGWWWWWEEKPVMCPTATNNPIWRRAGCGPSEVIIRTLISYPDMPAWLNWLQRVLPCARSSSV